MRIGIGRHAADRSHRQGLRTIAEIDDLAELRGDVGMQTLPGRRPGRTELGVEAFLGLGHLVGGARREDVERAAVLGDFRTDARQVVDAE